MLNFPCRCKRPWLLIINSYDKTAEKQEHIAKAAVEVFDQRRVFHLLNQTYAQVCSQIIISIVKNEKAFGPLKIASSFLRSRKKIKGANSWCFFIMESIS